MGRDDLDRVWVDKRKGRGGRRMLGVRLARSPVGWQEEEWERKRATKSSLECSLKKRYDRNDTNLQ